MKKRPGRGDKLTAEKRPLLLMSPFSVFVDFEAFTVEKGLKVLMAFFRLLQT